MSDSSIFANNSRSFPLTSSPLKLENKTKIVTHTGEDSQPARIYFQVFKKKTLLGVFQKLRCVRYEPQNTDGRLGWRWFYEQEAKKLKFKYSISKIPKEARPVVLGDFFFPNEEVMYLDVRSFERVIHAIDFFRKRINPRVAKVIKIQIVNRLFSAEESQVEELLYPPYDHFFNENQILSNLQTLENLLQEFQDNHLTKEQSLERLLAYLKQKSPEIEEILFDSSAKEALEGLQFCLTLRNVEASQHYGGNEQFSQWDLLGALSKALSENWDQFSSKLDNLAQSDEDNTSKR